MKPAPALQRPPSINHTPLAQVARILAVASGKGGVGKSTVTVNLAHALTALGQRVGILDADIYGPSIPRMLGLETYLKPEISDGQMLPPTAHGIRAMSMALITGEEAAVLRAPMITKALVQFLRLTRWGDAQHPLDILLVDLPPGTGDVTLSLAQNAPLDGLVLVTTPQEVAVIDADKCAQAFHKLQVPLRGVVENMSYFTDPAGTNHPLFGQGGGAKLAEKYHSRLLGQLPLDPAIGVCADHGKNFLTQHPASDASTALRAIARQLVLVNEKGSAA
ncbi:MAG: Mrp/NBP35 family ATP-binding protein [Alphaproteobacteria bacterium]|nr:Mrp/NBP35 family ATP-binding protein [Alphaproteobacteria bacterium]